MKFMNYISSYRFNLIDLCMMALLGMMSSQFSDPIYLMMAVVILIVVSGTSVYLNTLYGDKE